MDCLREGLQSSLDIFYEGDGNKIARDFYIPVLKRSTSYRHVSGYFRVDSLVIVAAGLAGLLSNGGKIDPVGFARDAIRFYK